jgi:hypothetical protein
MGLFSKTKSGTFDLVETSTELPKLPYTLIVDPKARTLTIHPFGSKKMTFTMEFDLIDCEAYMEPYDEEKKAWVGRTVAGGALFGKTGAIVGATTAGTKTQRKIRHHVNVTFKEDGKTFSFVGRPDSLGCPSVVAALFKEFKKSDWDSVIHG